MAAYDLRFSKKSPERLINPDGSTFSSAIPYKSPFDANLDGKMPKLSEVETDELANAPANSDPAKPVGMLSRIKNFVTDQASQFANEQMGTEEPGSSSGMGRVLRALAGAGAVGAVGGAPAMQLATGVAGTVRNLASMKEAARLAAEQKELSLQDRALNRENVQGQIDERATLNEIRQQNADTSFYDKMMKRITEGVGLLTGKGGRSSSVKSPAAPKPEKFVEFPGQEFNTSEGVSTLDVLKTNAAIQKAYVYPLVAKLKAENVFTNSKDLRNRLQDFRKSPELASVPDEYKDFVRESIVKEMFPNEATVPQKVEMLYNANPQAPNPAGKMALEGATGGVGIEALKALAGSKAGAEGFAALRSGANEAITRLKNWKPSGAGVMRFRGSE